MATEKYPHEIAIEDTVGTDLSKLPGDLRRRISGFNVSKGRTTDEEALLKQSHVLANDILDWDEKDLPEQTEDTEPQGAQGQQPQNQSTDTPAAGAATDSNTNTQSSTQELNTEGKKDDTPKNTDSSTQTNEEPEFITVPRTAPFGRVIYDKVKNPNYEPKS